LKTYLLKSLRELRSKKPDRLLDERYAKFRRMGVFTELELDSAAIRP
jgi:acetyl-CoA carboxylase alpha subunit